MNPRRSAAAAADRTLFDSGSDELRALAEDALAQLAGVLEEAAQRWKPSSVRLLTDFMHRRPLPGYLEPLDIERRHWEGGSSRRRTRSTWRDASASTLADLAHA